jgi:hypothetical protein
MGCNLFTCFNQAFKILLNFPELIRFTVSIFGHLWTLYNARVDSSTPFIFGRLKPYGPSGQAPFMVRLFCFFQGILGI